jgi:hypothetical protein
MLNLTCTYFVYDYTFMYKKKVKNLRQKGLVVLNGHAFEKCFQKILKLFFVLS